MKLGIVVPVLSNFKGCVEALESVNTTADWQPFIVPQWRRNRALAAAWNTGIEDALMNHCDYV